MKRQATKMQNIVIHKDHLLSYPHPFNSFNLYTIRTLIPLIDFLNKVFDMS